MRKEITVEEFEEKFERIEGLKIVIRAPKGDKIPDYPYKRALDSGKTIGELKRGRLKKLLEKKECDILTGDVEPASGKMKLENVKKTYVG